MLRIASGYSQLPRFPNTTGVVIDGSFCGNGCTTTAWNHTWTMNKGSALTATIHYSPLDPSAVDLMGDNDSNSASTWTGPILRTANITTDQTYHLYVHLNAAGENDALENVIQTWFEGQPTLAVGDADAHTRLRLATSPNPARGEVRITYTLPRDGGAEITVHDVLGRRVATLASGAAAAGTHEARWDGHATDGATARAGVYLVRVRLADGTTTSTRLVRIR